MDKDTMKLIGYWGATILMVSGLVYLCPASAAQTLPLIFAFAGAMLFTGCLIAVAVSIEGNPLSIFMRKEEK